MAFLRTLVCESTLAKPVGPASTSDGAPPMRSRSAWCFEARMFRACLDFSRAGAQQRITVGETYFVCRIRADEEDGRGSDGKNHEARK